MFSVNTYHISLWKHTRHTFSFLQNYWSLFTWNAEENICLSMFLFFSMKGLLLNWKGGQSHFKVVWACDTLLSSHLFFLFQRPIFFESSFSSKELTYFYPKWHFQAQSSPILAKFHLIVFALKPTGCARSLCTFWIRQWLPPIKNLLF